MSEVQQKLDMLASNSQQLIESNASGQPLNTHVNNHTLNDFMNKTKSLDDEDYQGQLARGAEALSIQAIRQKENEM